MHEFRVDFSECSFSEYAFDYENLCSAQVVLATRRQPPSRFARITSIETTFADSAHPPGRRQRSMHEFHVDFSECSFSE
jgi:hypothetical protein